MPEQDAATGVPGSLTDAELADIESKFSSPTQAARHVRPLVAEVRRLRMENQAKQDALEMAIRDCTANGEEADRFRAQVDSQAKTIAAYQAAGQSGREAMTPEERSAKRAFETMLAETGELVAEHPWEKQPPALRDAWTAAVREAVAEERERCARVADGSDAPEDERGCPSQTALDIAAEIRNLK